MVYARRTDANHSDIRDAFRKLGCTVLDMSGIGKGAPDACIGYGGLSMLVEIKDGAKPPSGRKLTAAQVKFWETWTGGVRLVKSLEDVAETVATLRKWHQVLHKWEL